MPDARAARELQLVDQVLTTVARQYRPTGYVYNQVAPTIQVQAESGKYPTFSGFFGDDADSGDHTKVSDRAETPEVSFDWSTESYYCEDYRLKVSITAKERRQAHAALRLEQSKLTYLLERMALRREIRIATALQDSGTTGGQLTGGTAAPANNWDVDAGTIEADIKTGALAVRGKVGRKTNAIVMDEAVAYAVALQADIREIIKYTVPGDRIISEGGSVLPPQIHGHRVLVASAMRNTAKKGATETLDEIWGTDVRLLTLPGDGVGGWGIPAVAYSFSCFGEVVDRWRENDPPVDYIRAWEDVDEKVCAPDAGYTITAVL